MALLISASLGGCAGLTGSSTLDEVARRPLRDLSVVRDATPDIRSQAALAPYAPPAAAGCPGIGFELSELDVVLGVDVDVDARPVASETTMPDMVRGTLQGAVDLPYRGVLRQLSGASRRERIHGAAVLAGMVRRGFPKGLARGLGCPDS